MRILQSNFSLLVSRLGLLFSLYFFCRIIFFIFNYAHFSQNGFEALAAAFFYGMRYDITAIVISNILFIILHLLPVNFFYKSWWQRVLKTLFIIINPPFLLLNCIDIGLFRFTGKRSGSEIFSIMSFGNDFINTVPGMILDYWYLLIIFFIFVFILAKGYPSLSPEDSYRKLKGVYAVTVNAVTVLLFAALATIGFRGGMQYKPLNVLSASKYNDGKTSALILNTPFTVIKTFGKQYLEEKNWMPVETALRLMPVVQIPVNPSQAKKNVVILILESFGKEYIGSLNNGRGYTPFLDSLIGQSLVFTEAFANGKRSIEGIPAIVAGIPALMDEPFITSVYSGNRISSLASLLRKENYSTCFFHGGTNGTMNFDNFAKLAGYEKYFGRTEYGDDRDFDGNWGIYDEPFLQRTASEITKMHEPFFATVFTLSSHHPYKIPDDLESKFPVGTLPIHRSIGYADYALRRFFDTARKQQWFANTLFVITADHTALSETPFYNSRAGLYSVPILYYCAADSMLKRIDPHTTQHIDILPSVLDYTGYKDPFFAFGKSVFDTTRKSFAVNYMNQSFGLISDGFAFNMDQSGMSLYNFTQDSTMKNNVAQANHATAVDMEQRLKAFIQNFNHAMISNTMHP